MNIIAYYRVSTKRQGQSGLGLEAQQTAVEAYSKANQGQILASYKEVETGKGKNPDRPKLKQALIHAKRAGATLVIAKLDRLSRNVAFLANLMESAVDFVACDNPHANRLTLHILAAIAEHEAKTISERTKVALQAAKRRGVKLGSAREGHWQGREEARLNGLSKARAKSIAARRARAEESHKEACERLLSLRSEGLTLKQIAERLNGDGFLTPHRKLWNEVYVFRFLKRCQSESE